MPNSTNHSAVRIKSKSERLVGSFDKLLDYSSFVWLAWGPKTQAISISIDTYSPNYIYNKLEACKYQLLLTRIHFCRISLHSADDKQKRVVTFQFFIINSNTLSKFLFTIIYWFYMYKLYRVNWFANLLF